MLGIHTAASDRKAALPTDDTHLTTQSHTANPPTPDSNPRTTTNKTTTQPNIKPKPTIEPNTRDITVGKTQRTTKGNKRSKSGDTCDADLDGFVKRAIDEIDNIIGSGRTKEKGRGRANRRSERTVFCEKCGSTFASVGNLNRHRRVSHQGVRVFCDFKGCKQSFSQVADLTRHRRRVHMCFTKYGQEGGSGGSNQE